MTTILPCPFCGSDSEVEEVGLGATNGVIFTIGCASKHEDACMGYQCFQTFALRKDAIAAWNKRAPQSSAPAQCVLSGAQLDDRLEAIAALPSTPSAPGGPAILKACDYLHDLGFQGGWNGAVEECAKIAEPWPGFWPLDNATQTDLEVIKVRKEIAANIRGLSVTSTERADG